MLNSTERRPAFDCFFASLDPVLADDFMHCASEQRAALQDSEDTPVSLIDCMENIWDEWRDLRHNAPERLSTMDQARRQYMLDPERQARERALREAAGLAGSFPSGAVCPRPVDRTEGELDQAVLAFRGEQSCRNRARVLNAARRHNEHFLREQTKTFVARTRLQELEAQFDAAGGRGVALADEIDGLREQLAG